VFATVVPSVRVTGGGVGSDTWRSSSSTERSKVLISILTEGELLCLTHPITPFIFLRYRSFLAFQNPETVPPPCFRLDVNGQKNCGRGEERRSASPGSFQPPRLSMSGGIPSPHPLMSPLPPPTASVVTLIATCRCQQPRRDLLSTPHTPALANASATPIASINDVESDFLQDSHDHLPTESLTASLVISKPDWFVLSCHHRSLRRS
jgi:hypothetical protein